MLHTLTLEVPEDIYGSLAHMAGQTGQTPEELAADWLASAVRQFADDPVLKFIGAFDSGGLDWADQHDKYIGQSLAEEMRGEP
ncbi:MAG: hypothetical protein AB7U82_20625 [Blastocatellales bacterium]